MDISAILLIIALILFALAASGRVATNINLTAAGLACLVLAQMVGVFG